MSEHLTDEQIESYRKRDMKPYNLLSADRHVLACTSCRERLNESGNLQAAFKNLKENLQTAARDGPDHLEYELLTAYVDKQADALDREIVESHIELCADCANELKELETFAAMLKTSSIEEAKPVERASWWQSLLSLIGLSVEGVEAGGTASAFRLAGAVAMVLLIAAASVFVIYKVLNSESGPIAQGNQNQSPPGNQNESPNANQQRPDNRDVAQGNQNSQSNSNHVTPQPTSVFAFLVPLGRSRSGSGDGTDILKIRADVGFVDLQIERKNADGKSFAGRLEKTGGAARTLRASVARNGVVSFRVPASALSAGEYHIKVFRSPRDPDDDVDEAKFTVEKIGKR